MSLPSTTTPSTLSTPWCTRAALEDLGAGAAAVPSSRSEPSSSPEPDPSFLSRGNRSRSCRRRSRRARFAAVFLARRCAALPPPPAWAAAGEESFAFDPVPFAFREAVGSAAARSGSESESLNLSRSSSLMARVSGCRPPGAPSARLVECGRVRLGKSGSQLCQVAAGRCTDGRRFSPSAAQLASRRLRANLPKAHDGGDHIHRERGEGSGRARGPGPRPRSRRARRDLRDRE